MSEGDDFTVDRLERAVVRPFGRASGEPADQVHLGAQFDEVTGGEIGGITAKPAADKSRAEDVESRGILRSIPTARRPWQDSPNAWVWPGVVRISNILCHGGQQEVVAATSSRRIVTWDGCRWPTAHQVVKCLARVGDARPEARALSGYPPRRRRDRTLLALRVDPAQDLAPLKRKPCPACGAIGSDADRSGRTSALARPSTARASDASQTVRYGLCRLEALRALRSRLQFRIALSHAVLELAVKLNRGSVRRQQASLEDRGASQPRRRARRQLKENPQNGL